MRHQIQHHRVHRSYSKPYSLASRNSGIALITSLVMLVILTMLALTMFRNFGVQQKIAGNVREKERAFQAAENSLRYAEWWLINGSPGTGISCSTDVTVNTDADMRVCSNALNTQTAPSTWTGLLNYKPPQMVVSTGGGAAMDGNGKTDINYSKTPGVFINYLGLAPNGSDMLYSITAVGYGGSTNAAAVVQSIFATTSSAKSLDNP